jgi:hypothetical protein
MALRTGQHESSRTCRSVSLITEAPFEWLHGLAHAIHSSSHLCLSCIHILTLVSGIILCISFTRERRRQVEVPSFRFFDFFYFCGVLAGELGWLFFSHSFNRSIDFMIQWHLLFSSNHMVSETK